MRVRGWPKKGKTYIFLGKVGNTLVPQPQAFSSLIIIAITITPLESPLNLKTAFIEVRVAMLSVLDVLASSKPSSWVVFLHCEMHPLWITDQLLLVQCEPRSGRSAPWHTGRSPASQISRNHWTCSVS